MTDNEFHPYTFVSSGKSSEEDGRRPTWDLVHFKGNNRIPSVRTIADTEEEAKQYFRDNWDKYTKDLFLPINFYDRGDGLYPEEMDDFKAGKSLYKWRMFSESANKEFDLIYTHFYGNPDLKTDNQDVLWIIDGEMEWPPTWSHLVSVPKGMSLEEFCKISVPCNKCGLTDAVGKCSIPTTDNLSPYLRHVSIDRLVDQLETNWTHAGELGEDCYRCGLHGGRFTQCYEVDNEMKSHTSCVKCEMGFTTKNFKKLKLKSN